LDLARSYDLSDTYPVRIFCCGFPLPTERAKKITNMDDKAISDLALQLETEAASDDDEKKAKDTQKKKRQVELRLAAEKKKDEKASKSKKKGKKADDAEEDENDALLTFAKGSRPAGKKKS
jgi:hypothetical protein